MNICRLISVQNTSRISQTDISEISSQTHTRYFAVRCLLHGDIMSCDVIEKTKNANICFMRIISCASWIAAYSMLFFLSWSII